MATLPASTQSSETAPRGRRAAPVADPALEAPFVAWDWLYGYLRREFKQGDHAAIIGPTGAGKTHIAFPLAEIRTYVLVVACKPKDPLITDAVARGYWLNQTDHLEVPYVDGRPLHSKVVYWPRLSERARRKLPQHLVLGAEKRHQKPRVGAALGYVRNEGHWCLLLDEGTWVCRDLNLQRDVDSALQNFRTMRASIIILGQRPSWMGRYVLNQPTHLFLFQTADLNDRKALGDISGFDSKLTAELVQQLDHKQHEALYLNTRTREMFRTVAPARKR